MTKPNTTAEINRIVKQIKNAISSLIVQDWLHTPYKEWGNKTPLQLIQQGDGQLILDAVDSLKTHTVSKIKT